MTSDRSHAYHGLSRQLQKTLRWSVNRSVLARHVLHRPGVDQLDLEPGGFQDHVPDTPVIVVDSTVTTSMPRQRR
jgi:hypothetical protein